ncbi:MAG: nitroreductase family protein [Luminiphilus sp.]|jgi:nitroreductase|nr:nitroreductase family protein [Luminiphilus sp.]
MDVIDTLLNRNSHARLTEPGPDEEALSLILRAAARAPDHGRLRPWRFVVVLGERRAVLGQCFAQCLTINGISDPARLEKAANAPLRAPLIIAGLVHAVPHDKISREEQGHAVAAALHGAQLAAESLGFGCIWRTGGYATDPLVIEALGGAPGDQVVGFLYLGTREGPSKLLPDEPLEAVTHYF